MYIYIAGPYTAETEEGRLENVYQAFQVAAELLQRKHTPFIPHLTHFYDQWAARAGNRPSYEEYMAWDEAWLERCDALYFIGPSPGADREFAAAKNLGIPIFTQMWQVDLWDSQCWTPPRFETRSLVV